MSEKLTVRTAKKISKKLENGTHFLGTVCQSVPFFRKNAKEFIRKSEKLHTKHRTKCKSV